MKFIKLMLIFNAMLLSSAYAAVIVNTGIPENLYLGNGNVSCGRYTLSDDSQLNSVKSYCTISQEIDASDGTVILKIQTTEDGIVSCRFINGDLDKCYIND